MSAKKLETGSKLSVINKPSILSFKRKLEPSHGLLFSGRWENRGVETVKIVKDEKENEIKAWQPLKIDPVRTLGTQSSSKATAEERKRPNPVAAGGDSATLPRGANTLLLKYTTRIIGGLSMPDACNRPDFQTALIEKVDNEKANLIPKLAYRFAYNIANGRFLWRNRVGADEIVIKVNIESTARTNNESVKKSAPELTFNAYDFSLKTFDYVNPSSKDAKANLEILSTAIAQGLASEDDFVLLSVEAYVKLGEMQQVYPSQEMNAGSKGKELFKKGNQAGMHDVKISNAIKTVDTWYDISEDRLPIAIEPWGAVTQRNEAHRSDNEPANDLYSLLDKWVVNNEQTVSDKDKLFVLANLVRGGLFQMVSDKK